MKTQLKKLLFTLLFASSSIILFSQINQWTWINGTKLINDAGSFGTIGVSDSSNMPGARIFGFSWTGKGNNLWLYGGQTYYQNGAKSFITNDLWRYNINTKQWTWMTGSTKPVFAHYGTKGISAPENNPGARYKGNSWVDKDGNLWLFGGYGAISATKIDILNDLWKYDINTNQWTWISGSDTTGQTGSYGQKGIADTSNVPGARESAISWTDQNGFFWLFGGKRGESQSSSDYYNDLWKYDPTTNIWTWVNGSDSYNKDAIYGTKRISDSTNTPGARSNSFSWVDKGNNLWLFGGTPYKSFFSTCNDLWKYNISINQWSWESGANALNGKGDYSVKGMETDTAAPCSRELGASFMDTDGKLWLLGGVGGGVRYNDMWVFNLQTKQWKWVAGVQPDSASTVAGRADRGTTYGTQGEADSLNKPGARKASISWTDNDGNFWLFGGDGYNDQTLGSLNDLWKYTMVMPTSVAETKAPISSQSILYPNPASSTLNLKSENSLGIITVKDITGRNIYHITTSNTTISINISELKSGIYFIESGKDERNVQRFIKQ